MINNDFIKNYKSLVTLIKNYDQTNNIRRFGVSDHQYRLMPPVAKTPANRKILNSKMLPKDYVDYMFNIANGGFSCYYGLLNLNEILYFGIENAAKDPYVESIYSDKGSRKPSNDDVYIHIEHQGCGYYTLLKIKGQNTGCVATQYDEFIEETNMTFKTYLLEPFFEDAEFMVYLKQNETHTKVYKFLLENIDEYVKTGKTPLVYRLTQLGII